MSADRPKSSQIESGLPVNPKAAAMGKLAASLGHEFNNPLGYVCSSVDYCKNYLTKLHTKIHEQPSLEIDQFKDEFAQLIEAMTDAQEGLARMNTIMHELQSFTSLRDLTFAAFNIDDIIHSLLQRLRHDGIMAYYEPMRPDLHVMADAIQLTQALEHIIHNAWQATLSSPEQTRIRLTTSQRHARVVISVEDYGVGMDAQTLKTMFDPFMTTHGEEGQLGLGLTLTRQIIEAHDGEIFAQSMPEQGTIVTIVLRGATASQMRVTAEQTITLESTVEEEDPTPRIAFISKDAAASKELAHMLFEEYELKTLTDVDKALAFFERKPKISFVLYDMDSMPTEWEEFFHTLDAHYARLVGVVMGGIPDTTLRHMLRKKSIPIFVRPLRRGQTLKRLNLLVDVLSM